MTPRGARRPVSRLRGLLALLLVPALLATGCVVPGGQVEPAAAPAAGSLPRFDLDDTLFERLALELPDGVTLDLGVFRPDVAKAGAPDERVPVLADVGPYFGNLAGAMEELTGFDKRLAEYFIPRGYAVARVSLRGTGQSEGCFGIGDEQERKDVAAAVEFLAAQPWSNGAVALIGKSYDGTTPWMGALEDPPSLKTIVPISGITDMYRYTLHDGVPYPETTGFHTYYPLLVDWDVNGFDTPPEYTGVPNARQNLVRTCTDLVAQAKGGNEAHLTGDHGTPYWQARDYEPLMDQVKVPVFLVHGLQDWNVKPDNGIPQYAKLDVPKAMWLGQWEHDYPDLNRHNRDWDRHDWNQTLLTWFDHWLKGVDNDWEALAHVEVQDTTGAWRTYATWPPADADVLTLHLTPTGALRADMAEGETGEVRLRDPLGMGYWPREDGPLARTQGSAPGAAFLTSPLPRDVTLMGVPTADLHLEVDQPGGQLVVRLWNVTPDGEWKPFDHGARSIRHRDTRDAGTDAPTGTPFNMTVQLYAHQTVLPAGHRLGVTVAPNAPGLYVETPHRLTAYRLLLGGDHASALTLHLAPGDADALLQAAIPDEDTGRPGDCFPACATNVNTLREIIK